MLWDKTGTTKIIALRCDYFLGGYSEEDPPVPIPNTVVKLFNADDTETIGKVGRCQDLWSFN